MKIILRKCLSWIFNISEVLAVIMPSVIPPLDAEFIILSGNIFPYFKLITSACPSKPRSIERLKNDDNGPIYERIQPMHIQPCYS